MTNERSKDPEVLSPELVGARALLALLFGGRPDTHVDLRAFKKGEPEHVRLLRMRGTGDASFWSGVADFVRENFDRDVYFGVAGRDGRGRGAESLTTLDALFVDVDFKDTPIDEAVLRIALLESHAAPPTIMVHSGGGLHLYWRLRDPLDVSSDVNRLAAKGHLRYLARVAAGDMRSAEPVRILRVPGTNNYKPEYGEPLGVEIIGGLVPRGDDPDAAIAGMSYDLPSLLGSLRAVEDVLRQEGKWEDDPEASGKKKGPSNATIPEGGVVPPGRQDAWLHSRAGLYRYQGMEEDEIAARLAVDAKYHCPASGAEWTERDDFRRHARGVMKHPADDPFGLTNLGDAEFFARLFSDYARYDHRRGRWLVWDGVRWAPQTDGEVYRVAADSQRCRAATCLRNSSASDAHKRWVNAGTNRHRIEDMLALARNVRPLADDGEHWDEDPFLLGVPNGVVDLTTGSLREGRAEDRITMRAGAPYDPSAHSDLWEKTLAEIFADDPEVVGALQKRGGYTVTGDVREDRWFMAHGEHGRNGKGTIFDAWFFALGDYAVELPSSLFDLRKPGGDYDLAVVPGKRLARSGEAGSTVHLNHDRIKKLTGGGSLRAANKYERSFEFVPRLKLWLECNTLPRVTDESRAFWARVDVVPFTRSFHGKEDRTVRLKLSQDRAHRAAVLAWLVAGAVLWNKDGLSKVKAIDAASEEYRLSQEPLAEFYDACCVTGDACFATSEELRAAYVAWCDRERIHFRVGPKRFSQELGKRFKPYRDTTGSKRSGFKGVGLRVVGKDQKTAGEDDDAPF